MSVSKTIPPEQQLTMDCPSCRTSIRYAQLPNIYPHFYCARCWNAYVEPRAQKLVNHIWWERTASRAQHDLQSHAPVCECGGLFLFNATPHCPHCRYSLPVMLPLDSKKARLRYNLLMVFPGSKTYLDNGTIERYAF